MRRLKLLLAAVLLMQSATAPGAAEIVFLCTDALAPAMRRLVPEFEKTSGHHVKTAVANAGTIEAQLAAGEAADLAIVLPAAWERLRQGGRVDPGTRIIIGKVGLGAFVKKGAAKPDIGTVDAFKQAVLQAKSLAVRDPAQRSPVGAYMVGLFERLALSERIKSKLILTAHPPYQEVSNGQAELGFSTLAEIAADPRFELAGPLPAEIQTYNVFTAAIPAGSRQKAAAGELLRFLTTDAAKLVLRASGIDPD